MEKELWINREKLIVAMEAAGTKKFFRALPDGRRIEIETSKDHLLDVLDRTLWPLDNLKDILGQEQNPGPIHYLLGDMLETLELKLGSLCEMVEEEFGRIEMYECNDVVPSVPRDTFLGVEGPSRHENA